MNPKRIAICLSTFNGQEYLASFLDSLERQDSMPFFIVVRDDFSSDITVKILQSYSASSRHTVTILQDQLGNIGPAKSFITVLENASADYYFWADQDDVWEVTKVRRLTEALIEKELGMQDAPLLAYSSYKVVDKNLNTQRWIGANEDYVGFKYENSVPGCTMAFNLALAEIIKKGPHPDCLHDWWTSLINYYSSGSFISIQMPLTLYRQHDNNVVGDIDDRQFSIGRMFSVATLRNFIVATFRVHQLNTIASGGRFNQNKYVFLLRRIYYRIRTFNNVTF